MVISVNYETSVDKPIEEKVKTTIYQGFNNWDGGYEGWLKWCASIYDDDAFYNVPGPKGQIKIPVQKYKELMAQFFQNHSMVLGQFENIIIRENWASLRYSVVIKDLQSGEEYKQNVMQFNHYKEYGTELRVNESWVITDLPMSNWIKK